MSERNFVEVFLKIKGAGKPKYGSVYINTDLIVMISPNNKQKTESKIYFLNEKNPIVVKGTATHILEGLPMDDDSDLVT